MKEKSFRKKHILNILKIFEIEKYPLDVFLSKYFRKNKSVGSKDRKEIADKIYKIIRWRGLIDFFIQKPHSWEKRLDVLSNIDINKSINNSKIPNHIKASFPKCYFEKIKNEYDEKKALEICLISNTPAPTTIRANTLKISRDKLFEFLLKKNLNISKCQFSKNGITFHKKINFFATEEYKSGLFEIQDEGSQLIADLIDAHPNDQVLDFCAGSGGKTLAFAPKMQNKGQIYLHDIRKYSLREAKKRLKRAGVENAQIIYSENFNKIKHKMDFVFLDVPCSGSGTLRRNPDMKWKFNFESLKDLIQTQRNIFKNAISFLKINGYIIYATCSIFKEENNDQIFYFLENYPIKLIKKIFWLPEKGGKDGFFASILQKK